MKKSLLLFIIGISGWAQTNLPGARVIPLPDNSAVRAISFLDLTGHSVGFKAANSITLSLIWTLPAADGSAGTCLGWTSPSVIDWVSCAGGGGGGLPVLDSTIITQSSFDTSRQMRFDNSIISTGQTRVLTVQDFDYRIAGINIPQTFTSNQEFTALALFSGTFTINTGVATTISSSMTTRSIAPINNLTDNIGGPIGGGGNLFATVVGNNIGAVSGYWMGGTKWMDSSLNLTNIAGIQSGNLGGLGNVCLYSDNGGNINRGAGDCITTAGGTISGNFTINSGVVYTIATGMQTRSLNPINNLTDNIGGTIGGAGNLYAAIVGNNVGAVTGFWMGATKVIDASRNLTNIGTITAASLSGGGTRCLQTDNIGLISFTAGPCAASSVTAVTATSPLTSSGGLTPNIALPVAGFFSSGYLTNVDWVTFNTKASSSLNNLSSVALNADILPASTASRSLGASTLQFANIYSRDVQVCESILSGCWQEFAAGSGGNRVLTFGDSAGTTVARFQTSSSGVFSPFFASGSINTGGVFQVGASNGITGGTCSHFIGGICTAP